jgi:hypothetical protein
MPNVWGEPDEQNAEGLTNPLTSNLDAGGFEIKDVDKVYTNEIHDNGQGDIAVHNQINMTNNKITNMQTPQQNKDAANKEYVDNAVSGPHPYDMQMAFTDNTSVIPLGNMEPYYYTPRAFTGLSCVGFLRFPVNTTTQIFRVYLGSIIIATLTFNVGSSIESNTVAPWTGTSSAFAKERIFVENISTATDSGAKGLLITLVGEI